jgi:hypothetical protein
MRVLVVIPHYFGPSHPDNNLPAIGSYIEPLGRIAALNELIVGLHRHFGPRRHVFDGTSIAAEAEMPERVLDIVVLATRGNELLAELGLAPGTFETEYVECKPPYIAFHAQRVLRERLGRYDFYCFMEDDLVIHDPAFFDKLTWFQQSFGPKTLLMPVRYELPATGIPAKVVVDAELADGLYEPFRRPGQHQELEGVWNGRAQVFRLPTNPHSGSFFLTREQMEYWVKHPMFDDRNETWMGPIESAGTLSVGRVFDIYKPLRPDPFFLELHHFGTRYASKSPPDGRRYGEPPLLAIAQNALRAVLALRRDLPDTEELPGNIDPSFSHLIKRWLAQGTAVELRARLDHVEAEIIRIGEEHRLHLAAEQDKFSRLLTRVIGVRAAPAAPPRPGTLQGLNGASTPLDS